MSIKLNRWTPEEDALLEQLGDGPATREAWGVLASQSFPGRSLHSVRCRYTLLQRRALGIDEGRSRVRNRPSTGKRALTFAGKVDNEAAALAEAEAARRRYHPTITGYVFGDPLPGRSALDKRNAGASA